MNLFYTITEKCEKASPVFWKILLKEHAFSGVLAMSRTVKEKTALLRFHQQFSGTFSMSLIKRLAPNA